MRPDRAVVVRERVVAGVAGRHRPHTPAGPEPVTHQCVDDLLDSPLRDDPAPQQMADVRAERVDLPLVAVQRERVEAAALLDPERIVEALLQLLRLLLDARGEVAVAPDLTRKLREPDLGVVHVSLHLAGRDRCFGERAVVETLRVARVLPRLVARTVLRAL